MVGGKAWAVRKADIYEPAAEILCVLIGVINL
jgi:hypothetical protein